MVEEPQEETVKKLLPIILFFPFFFTGCARDLSIVYGNSAKHHYEAGNYVKVVEEAKKSIDLNTDNGASWYWLGEGYALTGQYKEAIPALQKALKLISDTPVWADTIRNTHFRLGYAYSNLGNYDDAIASYSRAIERNPRFSVALTGRGWAHFRKKNSAEAGRDFEQALALEPNSQYARAGRAWTLYYQGDFEAARKDFDHALQIDSSATGAWLYDILLGKAFCYLALGDVETALSVMKKAAQANNNSNHASSLALIFFIAGDKEKATSYWGGKGRLGLEVGTPNNATNQSVSVVKVERDGPAEQAGMMANDHILAIDGASIISVQDFITRARALTPGSTSRLSIEREGIVKEVSVMVGTALEQIESHHMLAPILAKRKAVPTVVVARQPDETPPAPVKSSDVDALPRVTYKTNRSAYAVVIGIERYRQRLPKADYAVSDAKLMSEYLTKIMGYPEENIVTLTNENASKGDLEKYFDQWLKNVVEKNGTVFVYYSGHGAPHSATGDAYLVPYDGDPAFIEQTGYSLKRLYENLSKLPAKNIIVALDSCFSGAGGKSVSAKGSRALVRVEKTSALNIAVLTASQDNQISSSYEDKGHGVFTYFLLKGIKEMLGEDKNSKLELGELYNYIKPQVERTSRRLYNNEQTPQLLTADEQMKKIGLR
jgi:tetratricopeptide (TPR) repeat protein